MFPFWVPTIVRHPYKKDPQFRELPTLSRRISYRLIGASGFFSSAGAASCPGVSRFRAESLALGAFMGLNLEFWV